MNLKRVQRVITKFFFRIRYAIFDLVVGKICKWNLHAKGNPTWVQSGYAASSATYRGKCRICNQWITPEYSFNKQEGPVFDNVPIIYYSRDLSRRDLHKLIESCIIHFLPNDIHK